ncbi:MAG: hypothetical protein M1144_00165, partial [Candidatus Thermoplasmatota archaeon]|nr:hypothetical protein [Candidatus Thermoplasmatota archaeon]
APKMVDAARHPNVKLLTYAELGQAQIVREIKGHNLNRVVVAGCSPRMHEPTFRRCLALRFMRPPPGSGAAT